LAALIVGNRHTSKQFHG